MDAEKTETIAPVNREITFECPMLLQERIRKLAVRDGVPFETALRNLLLAAIRAAEGGTPLVKGGAVDNRVAGGKGCAL